MRKATFLMLAFLMAVAATAAPAAGGAAAGGFPSPTGYVSDFAGVLSPAERQKIEDLCASLETRTGAQMAIVTVETTGDQSVQMYAVSLFEAWGIGQKGKDNGLLVLLAMNDRRVWVEVGYGLEGVLPDGKVGAILDRHLVPAFKEGRYGDGIWACAQAFAAEIEAAAQESERTGGEPSPSPLAPAVALGLVVLALAAVGGGGYLLVRSTLPRCPSCRARLLVREQVLVPATLLAAGSAMVHYDCPRCGYHREKQRILPRLIPIHSDDRSRRRRSFGGPFPGGGWFGGSGGGFGGFGGGRSGGGGAGRSW